MLPPNTSYHIPVLLHESIEGLNIRPEGTYIDATFGGGGHSMEILKKLDTGRLIAFDKDPDVSVKEINNSHFHLVQHDFKYMKNFLLEMKAIPVDGIIADLGVSSHQLDTAGRGFSYRTDALLDMRMDKNNTVNAYDIINNYAEYQLIKIFRELGEVNNPARLARAIIDARPVKTTIALKEITDRCCPPGFNKNKYAGLVFQSVRITVNDEISALKKLLRTSADILGKGGRLVVISYHSLEDRLVKNFIKTGNFEGKAITDLYGSSSDIFRPVTKKPVVPTENEINENPRARSARLRIGEKL